MGHPVTNELTLLTGRYKAFGAGESSRVRVCLAVKRQGVDKRAGERDGRAAGGVRGGLEGLAA